MVMLAMSKRKKKTRVIAFMSNFYRIVSLLGGLALFL